MAAGDLKRSVCHEYLFALAFRDELLRTFNLGVGMILVLPVENHKAVETELKRRREKFVRIGRIERGDTGKARLIYSGALSL